MVQPIQTVEGGGAVTLGHRGVIEDIVDEVLHRASIGQDRLTDVNQFGGTRPDDMDAKEPMGLGVKDHL